jgi:hypothetical protein
LAPALDLRPLTLGELLDRAFSLYRSHFATLVAIMAVPAVLGAGFALFRELIQGRPDATGRGASSLPPELATPGFLVILCLGALFYLGLHIVAVGATTAALSEVYMGRPATAGEAYARVRGRTGPLLMVLVLTTFRVVGIIIVPFAIVVPLVGFAMRSAASGALAVAIVLGGLLSLCSLLLALLLMLRYSLAVPATVIESVTAREAIRRSIDLMRGNLGRAFVLIVFGFVIAQITALVLQGPFLVGALMAGPESTMAFWLTLAGTLTGALGDAISSPLTAVAFALLYYDARVRHEGLDLQIMMDALGDGSAGLAPPRPSAAH